MDAAHVQDTWCGDGGADGLDSFGAASSVLMRSRRAGDHNTLLRRVGEINWTPTLYDDRFLNLFCTVKVERVGPRTAGMVGSACWSGALLTTAAGVESHVLPLVYLGYGALGGVGWGLLYLTPVVSFCERFRSIIASENPHIRYLDIRHEMCVCLFTIMLTVLLYGSDNQGTLAPRVS